MTPYQNFVIPLIYIMYIQMYIYWRHVRDTVTFILFLIKIAHVFIVKTCRSE